jgi:uncharacterized protein YqeY
MSSTVLDRILADVKAAMKAGDKERVLTLRTLHAEINNRAIQERRELTDEDVAAVLQKAVKQRMDSIEQFRDGGRDDLVARETAQLEILREYLPRQMDRPQIEALVDRVIADTGASGKKDLGRVMKALMPEVRGRADGKLVNRIVAEKLA